MNLLKYQLVCAFLFFLALPSLRAEWTWENDLIEANVTPAEYKAVFTFRNNGDRDLSVSDIQSCCNCTTHSHTSTIAKPGQTGTLTIVIDRAKSKTSKKLFDFLVTGTSVTPQKLQVKVPELNQVK